MLLCLWGSPAMFHRQWQRSTFGWIEPFVISPHILIALQKTSRCKSCYRRNSSQSDQTGNSFLLQLQNTEFYPQTFVHNYIENLGPPIFFCPLALKEVRPLTLPTDWEKFPPTTSKHRFFIGDDENDNDNNPTKIMLESGVCLHTPASSMIFVGLLSLPNSFLL